jgi:DNA-directed RNA polymerase specialized sigma subunit
MKKTDNFAGGRGDAGAKGRSFSRTKEVFVEAIDAFAAEHGRSPYYRELAAVLGVTPKTVSNYEKRYGVELPKQSSAVCKPPRYTKEELVEAVDAFAAEHGRLPFYDELAAVLGVPTGTVYYYIGKYGIRLPKRIAAGGNTPPRYTKEDFVAAADALAAEHGRPPFCAELAAVLGVAQSTISNYKKRYGVELPKRSAAECTPPRCTKEDFVAAADAFAAEYGRPPYYRELAGVLGVTCVTVGRYGRKYGVELSRRTKPHTYTKEEFVAAADALAAEHGRPPYYRELAAVLGVSRDTVGRYGSKYGVELSRKTKPHVRYTREEFVAAADALAAEHGRPPYYRELAAVLGASSRTAARYGSKYGVEFSLRAKPHSYSKEEFVAAADAFAAEHGRPPDRNEIAAVLGVSYFTADHYCRKYDVKLHLNAWKVRISKEEFVAATDALAAEHGRPPDSRELAAVLGVSCSTVSRYCRNYGVRIPRKRKHPFYTKEDFVAAVDAFAAEHGRPPSRRELMAVLGVSKETVYSYLRTYGGSLYRKNASIPYTKEAFVEAVDAFAAEHGRPPDRDELAAVLGVSYYIADRYGRKYGVKLRHKTKYTRYTKEEVVAAADAFAAEHGMLPSRRELAAVLGVPYTVVRYCCRIYGVKLRPAIKHTHLTKEEVVAAVDAFAAEHGRLPFRGELAAVLGVTTKTVRAYCLKYGVSLPRKGN